MNLFHDPRFGKAVLNRGSPIILAPEPFKKEGARTGRKAVQTVTAKDEAPPPPVSPRERRARSAIGRALGIAKRTAKALSVALLVAHIVFIASTSLLIFLYRWVDPPVTVLMAERRFSMGFKVKPMVPLRLHELNARRRNMLVRTEDWNFYGHGGFDLPAIKYAWLTNKKIGRNLYGGSTLSMQTARSLFLVPTKSYFRKYLEAIVTVELESILPKDRILELYLDCAEWGRGIFGLKAACAHFYGTGLAGISDDQYARLVAILSSPVAHGPEDFGTSRILKVRYANLRERYFAQTIAPEPEAGAESAAEIEPATEAESTAEADPAASAEPAPSIVPAPNG